MSSGGSKISRRRGVPTPGGTTYELAKFRQKLHENEENWTERGRTSKILLCISATDVDRSSFSSLKSRKIYVTN